MSNTPKVWGVAESDDPKFRYVIFDRDKVVARVTEKKDSALIKAAPLLFESNQLRMHELETFLEIAESTGLAKSHPDFIAQVKANYAEANELNSRAKGEIS